ncbi:MAG TPA: hypothetical protein VN372_14120 [Methanospirillum sp.]|nr:hypothetical protein [Methanospirillum sp.]
MKVTIKYGTIRQGDTLHQEGDLIDISESKLSRFGDQVVPWVEKSPHPPQSPSDPPKVPEESPKEPEQPSVEPPSEESGKKKGKQNTTDSLDPLQA